jgi:hypothetical protein
VTVCRGWWVLIGWWVVVGFLQNFLYLRVHEGTFEKNPPQPTTMAKPTTQRATSEVFLPERQTLRFASVASASTRKEKKT